MPPVGGTRPYTRTGDQSKRRVQERNEGILPSIITPGRHRHTCVPAPGMTSHRNAKGHLAEPGMGLTSLVPL